MRTHAADLQEIDTSDDGKLDLYEFKEGCKILGLSLATARLHGRVGMFKNPLPLTLLSSLALPYPSLQFFL